MRPSLFAILALIAAAPAQGQVLTATFDSPEYVVDNELADVAGQNGWAIDDATPDLSFFVLMGYLGSAPGNMGAAVGAYLDAPVEPRVELSNTYGGVIVDSVTSLKFAVQASTTEFPGEDSFGWSYRDGSDASLLTISLEPNPAFADRLEVVWYDTANVRVQTGYDLFYGNSYDLSVSFTGSGADAIFSASIAGAEVLPFTGSLVGAAGATLTRFGASISRDPAAIDYGDNYLVFDNLSIQPIPEPASALLVVASLLVGVAGRRRR